MSVLSLDRKLFEKLVNEEKKTLLLDFWAPWCTYCRRLEPAYNQAAAEAEAAGSEVIFAKVNIDDEPQLADQFGIEIIPTLVLFQGGQAAAGVVNPPSKAAIEAFLADNVKSSSQNPRLSKIYDTIVLGGGPAGYTAALYTSRSGLSTLVLEQVSAGGQMALTSQIDNYPGFEDGIDGFTLGQKMQAGAERFGTETLLAEVRSVQLSDTQVEGLDEPVKIVETSDGTFYGRTVILATGAKARKLGIEKEDELVGKGINYCAACDGNAYRGKTVIVVGGGNSAAADALPLSRLAEKVYIVHRRDTLRATKIYHKPLMEAENVEFLWDSAVEELKIGRAADETCAGGACGLHNTRLTAAAVRNLKTGEVHDVACDGIFVSVGRQPASGLFAGQVELDGAGYVIAGEDTKTSLPGVFAIGDLRTKTLRQVITAAADGAVASHYVEEYLAERG